MKKLFALLIGAFFATNALTAAAQTPQQTQMDEVGYKGFALGMYYDDKIEYFLPYLQGYYSWFTAGIGANYEHNDIKNGENWSETFLVAHLGFRAEVVERLYASIGASGSYGFIDSHSSKNDPYTIGAYVGLEYFLGKHFLISAQIMPYTYEKDDANVTENVIFQEGQVGISYVF